jgi:DNA-binding CsgD family transcriptional regulator
MTSSQALVEFVAAVHGSRSLVELRSSYLSSVAHLVLADAYGLYFLDPSTHLPVSVAARGAASDFLDRYEEAGRACDPLLVHMTKTGEPVHDNLLFSTKEWKREPLREVMAVQNLGRSLQAPILLGHRLHATLNFARYHGRPAFTDRDLRVLRLITPHVAKTFERLLLEQEGRERLALAEAALESLALPVIVADQEGRPLYINRRAGKILESDPAFPADDQLLDLVAEQITKTPSNRTGSSAVIRYGPQEEARLAVRVRRLPQRIGYLVLLQQDLPPGLEHTPGDLSRRECEVLELVVQGLRNKQIADTLDISGNTVKHHLRGLFAKMEVSSRAELAVKAGHRDSGKISGSSDAVRPG